MLLDFLREIEKQRELDELSEFAKEAATEESKSTATIAPPINKASEVVADVNVSKD